MRVPREIIFLNGAPGSGKGVNTPHILATRGIDSSICVSSLLVRARARARGARAPSPRSRSDRGRTSWRQPAARAPHWSCKWPVRPAAVPAGRGGRLATPLAPKPDCAASLPSSLRRGRPTTPRPASSLTPARCSPTRWWATRCSRRCSAAAAARARGRPAGSMRAWWWTGSPGRRCRCAGPAARGRAGGFGIAAGVQTGRAGGQGARAAAHRGGPLAAPAGTHQPPWASRQASQSDVGSLTQRDSPNQRFL
jgi:hypothetical protein